MLPELECTVDENTASIGKSKKRNPNEDSRADNASAIICIGKVEESSGDCSDQDPEVKPFLIKSTSVTES